MKLHMKTLLVVGLTFLGLIILLYYTVSHILKRNYNQLEKEVISLTIKNTFHAYSEKLLVLSNKVSQWAPWDDSYQFIVDRNQEYIDKNLQNSVFANLRINIMAFINTSAEVVYAKAFDLDHAQEMPVMPQFLQQISQNSPLFHWMAKENKQSGVMILHPTPMLIVSHPILTSYAKGPVRGYLIMGRFWDSTEAKEIETALGYPVLFTRIDDAQQYSDYQTVLPRLLKNQIFDFLPLDENTIAGYAVISDIFGNPGLILKITLHRYIYQQSRLAQSSLLFSLMTLSVLFSILISLLLHRFILSRLAHLRSDIVRIGKSGRLSLRLKISGKDEIADFTVEINRMLENLEYYYEKLQESETRFRNQLQFQQTLMDTIPIPVYYKDVNGRYLNCNAAFEKITGKCKEDLLGKTVFDIFSPDIAQSNHAQDLALYQNPGLQTYEQQRLLADGNCLTEIIHKAIFMNSKGYVGGIVGAILDITERKKAEETLRESERWIRNILDSINVGILIIEEKTRRIVDVNQKAVEMFGAAKESILGNECCRYILPAASGNHSNTDLHPAVDNSERILMKPDGSECPIIETVNRISLNGRQFLLESFIDNTDRKKAEFVKEALEEQLRQSQKMEAIGQLTAGIAHNFNNLLTGMLGHIRLAKKKAPESIQSFLEIAISTGQKAADMIHQLLLFTRSMKTETQSFDLNTIVQEVVKICRQTFDQKIDIQMTTAEHLPNIDGNPVQIHQVLLNLCINARDALEQTSVHPAQIQIRTDTKQMEERLYVTLEVKDNGIGMDYETQQRIFEPFFTTKEVGKGTGLGLTTVYGIIEQHQGWIEVKSQPGKGAAFLIYLPIGGSAIFDADEFVCDIPTGTETILVIDDDETIRVLVQNILEDAGFSVFLAPDGESGLRIYQENQDQIHLVLLDLSMPKMSGEEVLAQLLKLNAGIRVIIISGYVVNIRDLQGAKAVCSKPFDDIELLQTIRTVLDAE